MARQRNGYQLEDEDYQAWLLTTLVEYGVGIGTPGEVRIVSAFTGKKL